MALVVFESGRLYQALTLAAPLIVACGGSALEGSGPEATTNDVEEVEEVAEVIDDGLAETISDGEVEPEISDTDDGEVGDTDDGEVDVGPVDWEPVALGDEGVIDDVVIVSAQLGFAASGSRVLRWDGQLWGPYGAPSGGRVYGVWADEEVVVAVGEGGLAAWRPVTGGSWQPLAGAPDVALRAVVARGADDVFAAGDDATVIHWDGQSWEERFSSSLIDLRAMWLAAESTGDEGVVAVGTGGQLVSSVGGTWKATQIAAASVMLEDIDALADGTLVAVGDGHTITIRRPQAPAWQGQVSNDERLRDLTALAGGDGADSLRIFGIGGAVLIGNAGSWNVDTTAASVAGVKNFAVADGVEGGPVVALIETGGGIALADGVWSAVATTPDAMLRDFAVLDGELWAVGDDGFLARETGDGWTVVPSGTSEDLFGLAARDEGLLVVGARGTIIAVETAPEDPTMVTTTPIAAPAPVDLYAVTNAPDGALACGRGGTLVRVTDSVTVVDSTTTADLRAIALGGDGRVWAGGAFGTLLHARGDDGSFELVSSGVGGSLSGLAPTADGVLAVGDNGVILRAGGDGVALEHEDPGKFLYAVATTAGGSAVAVGSGGLVLVDDGSGWQAEVVSEPGATFDAAHLSADGSVAIIGGSFRLMHVEVRRSPLGAP